MVTIGASQRRGEEPCSTEHGSDFIMLSQGKIVPKLFAARENSFVLVYCFSCQGLFSLITSHQSLPYTLATRGESAEVSPQPSSPPMISACACDESSRPPSS